MNIKTNTAKAARLLMLCGVGAGCAAAAAADATSASAAASADAVPHVAVHYDTALLATDAGARTVYRRLVRAAEQVCPEPLGSRLVNAAIQQCREQAVARAVREIDDPRLAAIKRGQPTAG